MNFVLDFSVENLFNCFGMEKISNVSNDIMRKIGGFIDGLILFFYFSREFFHCAVQLLFWCSESDPETYCYAFLTNAILCRLSYIFHVCFVYVILMFVGFQILCVAFQMLDCCNFFFVQVATCKIVNSWWLGENKWFI